MRRVAGAVEAQVGATLARIAWAMLALAAFAALLHAVWPGG
jgi:hypothetical protein